MTRKRPLKLRRTNAPAPASINADATEESIHDPRTLGGLPLLPLAHVCSFLQMLDLARLRKTNRSLMSSVNTFVREPTFNPHFEAVVLDKFGDGYNSPVFRTGFDVHFYADPEVIPLYDIHHLRKRITTKDVIDTTPGSGNTALEEYARRMVEVLPVPNPTVPNYDKSWIPYTKKYGLNAGKLACITMVVRTTKDPLISALSELFKARVSKAIVARMQNDIDLEMCRQALKEAKISRLEIRKLRLLTDEICLKLSSLLIDTSPQCVLLFPVHASTLTDPGSFLASFENISEVKLEVSGIDSSYWQPLLQSKADGGCKVVINDQNFNPQNLAGSTVHCVEWSL